MDYSITLSGQFKLDKTLDKATANLINGLAKTRRMKRNLEKLANKYEIDYQEAKQKFGIDGEFYYDPNDFKNYGQTKDETIENFFSPPSTQPSIWCQWIYSNEDNIIKWNQNTKLNNFTEWIIYIIEKILKPRNYKLTGSVKWVGSDSFDKGEININNNKVRIIEQ